MMMIRVLAALIGFGFLMALTQEPARDAMIWLLADVKKYVVEYIL